MRDEASLKILRKNEAETSTILSIVPAPEKDLPPEIRILRSSGNRTLVFTLTGDIQAGQNITLSIGQKSSNYDALIPLSGLREDSNGKFVYVLQSKNSPLGSRYIATRVTVQELARDDKSAAVSGISSGDFIITTSNKPVEAGKQVRLAGNG